MDDKTKNRLAAKHQRCAFPTNPQEDKKGMTVLDYAVIKILAALCANPEFSEWSYEQAADTAVKQAIAVFSRIDEEGF